MLAFKFAGRAGMEDEYGGCITESDKKISKP